jgi:hypothetical protein
MFLAHSIFYQDTGPARRVAGSGDHRINTQFDNGSIGFGSAMKERG